MKEIVKYEDNGGALWDTKEEAMLADSNLVLREFFSLYCSHYELDEWIDGAKKDPKIIKALIHVLDINEINMAVDRMNSRIKEEGGRGA